MYMYVCFNGVLLGINSIFNVRNDFFLEIYVDGFCLFV